MTDLEPSKDEPSVWASSSPNLIEVNFVGMDPDTSDATYMPDQKDQRARIATLLERLEELEVESS